MAETMIRVSPAQLQQMHERVALKERTRIAEEIAGRAVVERTLGNESTASVLDEIVLSIAPVQAPRDAERQPARMDRAEAERQWDAAQHRANGTTPPDAVPIGPNVGEPKRVKLTPEQIAQEAARLVVPGMEREKFAGWDATGDDGLAPVRERSDDEDIRRLVR